MPTYINILACAYVYNIQDASARNNLVYIPLTKEYVSLTNPNHRRCRPCFQRFPESYVYPIARLTSSCPLETLPSDILHASTRSIHSECWPYFGGIFPYISLT